MTVKEGILRFLFQTYLFFHFKFHFIFDDNFDPKRTDPYLLLGNHVSLLDGLYTVLPFKHAPIPVINMIAYQKPFRRFFLMKVMGAIAKKKGQSDVTTIRQIIDTIEKGQKVIMLFPEEDVSLFGEGSVIPYSTAKLLKKIKTDIVVCKVNGGYLSAPRWADHPITGGLFEAHYQTLVTAKELETIGVDELYQKISTALAFNDFDWNRSTKHKYSLRHRAEGLQRYLYICPLCHNPQSIHTKKNRIYCKHCGKIAEFNAHSLLEGLPFDNLVEWNHFQKSFLPELIKKPLRSRGTLYEVKSLEETIVKIGNFDMVIDQENLVFANQDCLFKFRISEIKNPSLFRKDNLTFDYEENDYFVCLKDPVLFLDVIQFLTSGFKTEKAKTL